jgi:hypothetical protein
VRWSAAATSIAAYAGPNSISLVYQGLPGANYSGSAPDAFGNDTAFTFVSILPDGLGLPDAAVDSFLVQQMEIVHGGDWGDVVAAVTPLAYRRRTGNG